MPVPARFLPLLFVLSLAACTDPVARCAGPETRELRTVEKLIVETRERLDRGYVLERRDTGAALNLCVGSRRSNVGVSFCTDPGTRTQAVAIDTEAEKRKLASLTARREALLARINALTAQCAPR